MATRGDQRPARAARQTSTARASIRAVAAVSTAVPASTAAAAARLTGTARRPVNTARRPVNTGRRRRAGIARPSIRRRRRIVNVIVATVARPRSDITTRPRRKRGEISVEVRRMCGTSTLRNQDFGERSLLTDNNMVHVEHPNPLIVKTTKCSWYILHLIVIIINNDSTVKSCTVKY